MHSACPLVVIGFAILYALALGPFIVGMFGLSVVCPDRWQASS